MVDRAAVTSAVNRVVGKVRALIGRGFKSASPAERRTAASLLVLFSTGCRPGNERYTAANNTRGLTTLQLSHLKIHSAKCVMVRYTGKKQVRQEHNVCSPDLVKWVRYCAARKQRVFLKHQELVKVLRPLGIRPKDVRTWKANELYKCHTRKLPHAEAVRNTAHTLGNTPSVTARSYVAPELQHEQRLKEMLDRNQPARSTARRRSRRA